MENVDLADGSEELDARCLHVLEIGRMVHVPGHVNIAKLDRQPYTELPVQGCSQIPLEVELFTLRKECLESLATNLFMIMAFFESRFSIKLAKYADLAVRGSVENIQNLVLQAFTANGFNVQWDGPTKGKAEKGSKGANILLGAAATHHAVSFEIYPANEGGTLRLIKVGSGASGGLLGMRSANKQFDKLTETLSSWFTHQGLLLGVKKE